MKEFGKIFNKKHRHVKALAALDDVDAKNVEDIDEMVSNSMKEADDILKQLSRHHHVKKSKKKHSHIGFEADRVQKRRVTRLRKASKTSNSVSEDIKPLSRPKKSATAPNKKHSLIGSESEHDEFHVDQTEEEEKPHSSGLKHLIFPQEHNLSPVNKTQQVQVHNLISQEESELDPSTSENKVK